MGSYYTRRPLLLSWSECWTPDKARDSESAMTGYTTKYHGSRIAGSGRIIHGMISASVWGKWASFSDDVDRFWMSDGNKSPRFITTKTLGYLQKRHSSRFPHIAGVWGGERHRLYHTNVRGHFCWGRAGWWVCFFRRTKKVVAYLYPRNRWSPEAQIRWSSHRDQNRH